MSYLPRLSDILPASVEILALGQLTLPMAQIVDRLFYQNLAIDKALGYYEVSIDIVIPRPLELSLFGDISLVLNPLIDSRGLHSVFSLHARISFPILSYLNKTISTLPSSLYETYELILDLLKTSDSKLLKAAIGQFVNSSFFANTTGDSTNDFVDIYNAKYNTALSKNQTIEQLSLQISINQPVRQAVYELFIIDSVLALATLLQAIAGDIDGDLLGNILRIDTYAAIENLRLGLTLPRSILLPVDQDNKVIAGSQPSMFVAEGASIKYDSRTGLIFDKEIDFNLTRSQILNTGIIVEIDKIKASLTEGVAFTEAELDGRDPNFKGIYVDTAKVFLPNEFTGVSTTELIGRQLLIGTGGFSGFFHVGTMPIGQAASTTPIFQATLLGDIQVKFNQFELAFSKNEVTYSEIRGTFALTHFLTPNGQPAEFGFELAFSTGGYELAFTAPVVAGKTLPVVVKIGSVAEVRFARLAFGKDEDGIYLDLVADVVITQTIPIVGRALPSKIAVSKLRVDVNPASVAITAHPTWNDGTQLTVNPRDGFSLSKTLNLTILNVLKVEQLRLSTHKDPDGTLQTLATFEATLGLTSDSTAAAPAGGTVPAPGFHAHIANAGFTAALKPTPDGTGNLALANVQLGVKLPDSVGVSVNAGGLVGAGNLAILDNGNRYEGVLALVFRDKINLAAYGILTKNLPGGGDGPSLLALVTAQFQAIQLGLGFTLNAVGGLLGLHRAADTDNLRGLVRAGQLNKLLFPSPATASLAELTTTLAVIDAAFPATPGRYLIGLMARLGWGAQKTLITLDVALLVELPSPVRLMILGVIKTSLPSEENDLLKLRADFLGTVDFGSKRAAFDATLSDSHILAFVLTGDLAFRFYQGNNPLFVITAGGFHPAFQPPAGAGLTGLRRLTLTLSRGNDLRVTLTSYFAVTSNTVQFGSRLELYYRIARGLRVEGYFGFDVLFQFNPFHVQAHIEAGVAIKYGSRELLSLYLSLDVTGPGPWHIWGSASFKVWFVRISVNLDATIGGGSTEPALPATDVKTLLVTALNAAASWEVEAPKTALPGGVVLRPVGTTAASFFLDPRGSLLLRQRVVPLGVQLGKYGRGPITLNSGQRFDLTELVVGGAPHPVSTDKAVEVVRDFFAPDQFQTLTDAQKLSLPSFQLLPCGLRLGNMAGLEADEKATLRVVEYEHKLISGVSGGATASHPPKMSARGYQQLVRGGALGQEVEAARPSARAPQPVNWAEDAYVVVHAATLEVYDPAGHARFATQVEAEQYRKELVAAKPALAEEVLVVPEYQLELA